MADLTRKEFAALCRTTEAVVRTNIGRRKIIEDKLNSIDTEDPINKVFFNKYYQKTQQEMVELKMRATKKEDNDYESIVETVTKRIVKESDDNKKEQRKKKSTESLSWDDRKKKADALLQERRAEKEKLNLEKLAGKLMPVDLVFQILRTHNQDIFATFQNDAENLASIYCDILAGGDRKKLSEITTKLSEKLENVIKRAKEVSMSSIEQAVNEYAEVRNRGEKK
jgi:hypothetical protein